ncbi:MAG TPA: DUF5675 family protein [Burkholderiales bacterium]|nr:DUF5675 family protein [Burkholderiales bacterium]
MINGNLVRFAYLPDVTLGWLTIGPLRLATLEEGWRADPDGPGGQRRELGLTESCVPDGSYLLRPHFTEKYPAGVWHLVNGELGVYAPGRKPAGAAFGRDAILIHSGNHTDHIEGCILVGRRHVILEGRHQVLESRNALADLRGLLGGTDTHTLTIRPTTGTREPQQ